MNLKQLTIVWGILIFAFCEKTKAGDKNARQKLDEAVAPLFNKTTNWKSSVLAEKLRSISSSHPESQEALTANLFYANHLQSLESKENYLLASDIYNQIILKAPDSWQGCIARLNLTAALGFLGKYEEMQISASEGLSKTDFNALENSTDGDFKNLLATFSTPVSKIREAFQVLLAKACAKAGKFAEAEAILNNVHSQDLKKGAIRSLESERKRNPTPVPK